MLAHRIIPTLLARGHQLVKGERFQSWRSVGHVQQAVRIHQARGVDELIVLDIAATPEGRGPDFAFVEELTRDCFMPITVGGGVRSVEDVRGLLRAGADKVAIGTGALESPELIQRAAKVVGCQAIVVAVDSLDGYAVCRCGAASGYGANSLQYRAAAWARCAEMMGAGELLVTCVEREGTMQGYNLDLVRACSEAVSIPVIAHGGCSGPEDMLAAIRAGASAVAAGALFQFSDHTPRLCAEFLKANNVEARV